MPSGGCPGFCPQPRGIFPQRPSSCGLSRRPSSSSCPPCVGRANLLPTSLLIAQSPLGCQDPPYSKTLTPFPKREGGPDQARNSTEQKRGPPVLAGRPRQVRSFVSTGHSVLYPSTHPSELAGRQPIALEGIIRLGCHADVEDPTGQASRVRTGRPTEDLGQSTLAGAAVTVNGDDDRTT
jgi:hypothetical protein